MVNWQKGYKSGSLVAAAALCCSLLLAGCDDYVQITRDPDLKIHKLATWAWRPATEQAVRVRDSRPVISRDVISRNETQVRDTTSNNEIVRQRVKTAIEQTLASKGLNQISDPQAADFLVDYHFAVQRHTAAVPVAGGYPGLVCGPFGCWESWGWGPVGYEHIRFREGMIVFDFIQQPTKHLAYRAVGERHVNYDRFSLTQDQINGLVHHLLKDLKTK